MLYSDQMNDFFLDLSKTSRFDFEIWTVANGLIFSTISGRSDSAEEFNTFHKKNIRNREFQKGRFKKNGSLFGIQLKNGTDVMGSLITVLPQFYGSLSLKENDSKKRPNDTDVQTFLTHMARIVKSQMSIQMEREKMADELGQSFEDLYLYSKIGVQTMPLNFSGKKLYE